MNIIQPIRPLARRIPRQLRFRQLFITPKSKDDDLRNRELVLNILLVATLAVLLLAVLLLLVSYAALQNTYVFGRIVAVSAITLVVLGIYRLSRTRHVRMAASLLVGIYFLLATAMVYRWGVDLPVAVLLYGLIITFAGILLGAMYSLYAALGVISVLIVIAYGSAVGLISHDRRWAADPSSANAVGDIIGFSLVLSVLAIVCWLFNYQMERSLHRALKAETALKRQKALLEVKVEERTRELQYLQAEKLQQMYRFAEVGQMGTALMHELANHLTTLNIDIEDLEEQHRKGILSGAKESIRYIDEMVRQLRDQLQGRSALTSMAVDTELARVIGILRYKADKNNVVIHYDNTAVKDLEIAGDPTKFRQAIAVLISNAIDAYSGLKSTKREVIVQPALDATFLAITVTDHGKGIPPETQAAIFEPFHGTKKTGMGLGLYIAKQITEDYFGGTITVVSHEGQTTFTVTIKK